MNLELKDRGPQERSSGFFYTLSCEFRVHRAGSQVIIGIVQVSVLCDNVIMGSRSIIQGDS